MAFSTPLVTDNVYKFYAIFGLTLVSVSILGAVQYHNSQNVLAHALAKGHDRIVEKLGDGASTNSAEYGVIQARVKVIKSDRRVANYFFGGLLGVGGLIAFHGFRKWQNEVQVADDELKRLQVKQLKLAVGESDED